MRWLLSISLVSLAALGACSSQSLTNDRSGTGGSGGGGANTGGEGGNTASTGGTGAQSACQVLAAQYQDALKVAQSCAIGGSGQCETLVNTTLSVCGGCQTYVNDASTLNAIQQAWEGANCSKVNPAPPCALILCPAALNNVCAPNPNDSSGTTGVCSYVPGTGGTGGSGATGGSSGAGGSSPDGGLGTCDALATKYSVALAAAKSCTAGASGQCTQPVPMWLSSCAGGCTEYVNDATELNQLRQEWSQAGCGSVTAVCPAIACVLSIGSVCVATDGGAGVCSPTYSTEPF